MNLKANKIRYFGAFFSLFVATHCSATEDSIKLCQVDERNQEAVAYVGTRSTGGRVQLGLLQREGLVQENFVLEIGSGALMAAIPIMSFLDTGHYAGIDPNEWLMNASLKIPENQEIIDQKKPRFIQNTDFDASSLGISFDYIFAHSIMSHAAHWQLPLFLENCAKVLKDGGKVIFSIRLTEPNEYGNKGSPQETRADEWQYPGCSFFDKETVFREAGNWFSQVEHKKEYTALLTSDKSEACHDWFVLTK